MRFNIIANIIFVSVLMCSCASDEPDSPDAPVVPESDNLYLDFNRWVYQQMNHSYLWREDLPDSAACDYDLGPKDFFNSLLSRKDRFSYFTNNPYYTGSSEYYGIAYQPYKIASGTIINEVLYIRNPKLKAQGLRRGDFVEITEDSNGVKYNKLIFDGVSFRSSGESFHESLSRGPLDTASVLLDSVYVVNDKKVGYICYLKFEDVAELETSLKHLYSNNIDELIVDLRYNPGGYVKTCHYLCNCIVPSEHYDGVFQKCGYNDVISRERMASNGSPYSYSYFETPPASTENAIGTTIIPLDLSRVFFLTSKFTASASEAAIICLSPYMDVVTIGETTVGKGVGSWTIYDSKYRYAIQPITMRYFNASGESTPDEGLIPDIYVPDGYSLSKKEIGDAAEPLLSTALDYISGAQAPAVSNSAGLSPAIPTLSALGVPSFVTEFNNKLHNEID